MKSQLAAAGLAIGLCCAVLPAGASVLATLTVGVTCHSVVAAGCEGITLLSAPPAIATVTATSDHQGEVDNQATTTTDWIIRKDSQQYAFVLGIPITWDLEVTDPTTEFADVRYDIFIGGVPVGTSGISCFMGHGCGFGIDVGQVIGSVPGNVGDIVTVPVTIALRASAT
jgi:hypothetical protein